MTPDEFEVLVLAVGPGVQAKSILDTVQYRVGGKAFATLGWPAQGWAVIKVAAARQAWALSLSDAVAPEPGRRRKAGIVLLRLATLDEGAAIELLAEAWSFAHRTQAPRRRVSATEAPRALRALAEAG